MIEQLTQDISVQITVGIILVLAGAVIWSIVQIVRDNVALKRVQYQRELDRRIKRHCAEEGESRPE